MPGVRRFALTPGCMPSPFWATAAPLPAPERNLILAKLASRIERIRTTDTRVLSGEEKSVLCEHGVRSGRCEICRFPGRRSLKTPGSFLQIPISSRGPRLCGEIFLLRLGCSVLLRRESLSFWQEFPRKAVRRRDGPAGRLYKFAGLREITNLAAASPPRENRCPW